MTTPSSLRPRAALAVSEIAGLFTFFVGVITAFLERTTPGGRWCGSVLGDSDKGAVCDAALAGPTAWTWVLAVGTVAVLTAGRVVDERQKRASASYLGVAAS